MDELDKLMDELSQSIAQLNAVTAELDAATEDFTVTDEHRIITAEASPSGHLKKIKIATTWQDTFKPAELATQINLVVAMVQARALGFDVDPSSKGVPTELRTDEEMRAILDEPPAPVTEADRRKAQAMAEKTYREFAEGAGWARGHEAQALEELYTRMDELNAVMAADETDRAAEAIEGTEHRWTSDNRMVWAADNGSGIPEFGINENWAAKASGTTLTICISQVLDQIPEDGETLAEVLRSIDF